MPNSDPEQGIELIDRTKVFAAEGNTDQHAGMPTSSTLPSFPACCFQEALDMVQTGQPNTLVRSRTCWLIACHKLQRHTEASKKPINLEHTTAEHIKYGDATIQAE
jgi:hypothetical protein